MDFRILQVRLLARLRARVRNGEITERSLARLTGISQPHLHNVLKGSRLLSPELSDQVLARLQISLEDLLTSNEAYRAIPLLAGFIGPDCPYPESLGDSHYPFLATDVDRMHAPVAACLAPNPDSPPGFHCGGVVLLDCSEAARLDPRSDGIFALDLGGAGTVARVRRAGPGWQRWSHEYGDWQPIVSDSPDTLILIRGQVRLVIQHV